MKLSLICFILTPFYSLHIFGMITSTPNFHYLSVEQNQTSVTIYNKTNKKAFVEMNIKEFFCSKNNGLGASNCKKNSNKEEVDTEISNSVKFIPKKFILLPNSKRNIVILIKKDSFPNKSRLLMFWAKDHSQKVKTIKKAKGKILINLNLVSRYANTLVVQAKNTKQYPPTVTRKGKILTIANIANKVVSNKDKKHKKHKKHLKQIASTDAATLRLKLIPQCSSEEEKQVCKTPTKEKPVWGNYLAPDAIQIATLPFDAPAAVKYWDIKKQDWVTVSSN